MAEYLSPGIYVEEYDNSPRTIEGVGTSTAGFVGMAVKGPVAGAPVFVPSYAEFLRIFGGPLSEFTHGEYRYLASSVEQFFANGGTRCYVSRVAPKDAAKACATIDILQVEAASEGSWGNRIQMNFSTVLKKKLQLMEQKGERTYRARSIFGFAEGDIVTVDGKYNRIRTIYDNDVTFEDPFDTEVVDGGLVPERVLYLPETELQIRYLDETEIYSDLSFNIASPNYIGNRLEKSRLVRVSLKREDGADNPADAVSGGDIFAGTFMLEGGSDGSIEQVNAGTFIGRDEGAGRRTGIQSFLENDTVSMMAVPGVTAAEVMVSLVAHCEKTGSRFAVLDMPEEMCDTAELLRYREMIDSTYAAMYHPWLRSFDRCTQKDGYFPPSGAVMGVYARTDSSRGVHKAPANETVLCSGLKVSFTRQEQDILNPAGINLIRALPGQGIRVWGARTAGSNSTFRYVNVRRLFIYVEESIRANTSWVVFEPNDVSLWTRVRLTVSGFLETLWRSGMLAGASPEESFFVEIGPSTMTQDDIRNGRLICNIGIAPVRPAEFVIFRVTQYTSESASGR